MRAAWRYDERELASAERRLALSACRSWCRCTRWLLPRASPRTLRLRRAVRGGTTPPHGARGRGAGGWGGAAALVIDGFRSGRRGGRSSCR